MITHLNLGNIRIALDSMWLTKRAYEKRWFLITEDIAWTHGDYGRTAATYWKFATSYPSDCGKLLRIKNVS